MSEIEYRRITRTFLLDVSTCTFSESNIQQYRLLKNSLQKCEKQ